MYTTHHPCWDAKNRFGLPEELPLDFAPLAHIFQSSAAPVSVPIAADPAPTVTEEQPVQVNALGDEMQTELPTTIPKCENNEELRALWQLMKKDVITIEEIQHAVAAKGYFPEKTPLENLPADFIRGVLIGAWPQVSGWIKDNRPLPF